MQIHNNNKDDISGRVDSFIQIAGRGNFRAIQRREIPNNPSGISCVSCFVIILISFALGQLMLQK